MGTDCVIRMCESTVVERMYGLHGVFVVSQDEWHPGYASIGRELRGGVCGCASRVGGFGSS